MKKSICTKIITWIKQYLKSKRILFCDSKPVLRYYNTCGLFYTSTQIPFLDSTVPFQLRLKKPKDSSPNPQARGSSGKFTPFLVGGIPFSAVNTNYLYKKNQQNILKLKLQAVFVKVTVLKS